MEQSLSGAQPCAPTSDAQPCAPTGKLTLRLGLLRVELGGAVFSLRALSSAQAAYLRAHLEVEPSQPPEYLALQLAIESVEGLEFDGAPLVLEREPLEIWGRAYQRVASAQWQQLWHRLPAWVTDRLGAELVGQSYLGEPEKKDSSCTCGSANTVCTAAGQGSAAAPTAPDSSPTCPAAR